MDRIAFGLLSLFFLFFDWTRYAAGEPEALSCPEYQEAFDGSCYEFAGLQRPFLGAQKWCERGGGHLAFILNDEKQQFLQRHLDPKKDWWLGLAPAAPNLTLDTAATEVSLAWLDGSDISYNNWANEPNTQAACGHIRKKSGFRWEASENCSQELNFICQFDSRKSIACEGQNATLQCGSGQVIEINDSFYGRKTIHYCRTKLTTTLSTPEKECTWTDVADSVKDSCHGLQACQAPADAKSYGEPCPLLGSYLSVAYRCKDGLHLLMTKLAAVFDNVTINIKWLLQPYEGNLTCALNAGDGHTIDAITPEETESTVMHTFKTPGDFMVTVECSTSDWHVTAQKSISIQEPVGQFGDIKCYSTNTSEDGTNCTLLYTGGPVEVQVTVETGTNVSYVLQYKDFLLANSSADQGVTPYNITLNASAVEQIGHGCHNLTLSASNRVTSQTVFAQFELCLLELVEGLQASVIADDGQCPDSSDMVIGVSLEHGAPARLLFTLTVNNVTHSETREMLNGSLQMYTFGRPVEGSFKLNVQAVNAFSTSDFNVSLESLFLACENYSTNVTAVESYDLKVISAPDSVVDYTHNVTLSINGSVPLPTKGLRFVWKCSGDCKCNNQTNDETHVIDKQCLPKPFEISFYTVTVKKTAWFRKWSQLVSASKCIAVVPKEFKNVTMSCDNCTSVNVNDPVKLRLSCIGPCPDVDWYMEDPKPIKGDLETCYSQEGRRPLTKMQEGNLEFLVNSQQLRYSRDNLLNITVIAQGKSGLGFARYTLPIPDPEPTLAPSCSIFPLSGTVLDSFDITCQASSLCSSGCLYCFKTDTGKHLRCSNLESVKSILLPAGDENNNYNLSIVVTVKNDNSEATTTVHTQVRKNNSSASVDTLQSVLEDTVSQLEQDGLLSGEALGQIVTSVADILNTEADEGQKDARTKLREQMLTKMTTVLLDSPSNTSLEVQVTARAVAGLTQRSDELSPAAQEEASSLLVDLSSSLNTISVNQDGSGGDDGEVVDGAAPIVEAASNILNASSNEKVSNSLLTGISNVQNALLNHKKLNGDPIIIDSDQISVYVNRISPETMHTQDINIQRSSSSRFSFPTLPADVVSPDEPVDVRMMSFEKNPYSWTGGNISGTVGSVSLTRTNGNVIPVKNLPEEIEILLPRPDVGQENSTVLDLANYSTLIIDVPSPDVTLVLKMEPSENITFVVLLGSKNYPTAEDYVAKIQMPLENMKEEEKYTWVVSPQDRTGDVGAHFLVLKPKVEPGIKSVNTTVNIVTIAAQCKYWNEEESSWSEDGCRVNVKHCFIIVTFEKHNPHTKNGFTFLFLQVGPLTTPLLTQCLCNHLTFFGSSFFVMPNLVDVSRTAELFATFFNNPVVVCFVGAIFCAYLLVVIWARRKDIQDSAKVKITMLEDNDPLAEYCYMLTIGTGHRHGASTSSQVTLTLLGTEGESEPHHLTDLEKPLFERGADDVFLLTTHFSLGELQSIRLWHDNSGTHPAWYVNKVIVQDLETGQKWHFLCNSWLAVDVGDCTLDKVFPVATEEDLKRFSNLFFMKTAKDFRDGHIWFSVISRPPCSTFTRVQRVSCCFSLLLCTMLTSIMFWGIPTDPSEQTMDLGHIEFTWQQVMIGIQSSIIMFPINLLIVSIFRNTRPREKVAKSDKTKQGKTVRVSPSQASSPQKEQKDITPDTVLKDIKRIAQSLSKAMKSPLPHLDLRPGQQTDINTLLSLVEDIIRQQNRTSSDFYTDTAKRERSILSLGAVDLQEKTVWGSPEKNSDAFQKKSNNSRYLYRQLRHVEKKLGFLGSSRFPNPESYNKAMEQVQGMKNLLEFHLPSPSLDGEQSERSPSPEESINKGSAKKCCQGGLPWWFVFIGWTLVIATSGVSGYFTMMYGLTYGKDRSISWLISMVVSFFESLFITQPLKVLGFAAFFALVLKKVDQEEYGEPQIDESLKNSDDSDGVRAARRDSTCSFYQPPPPTDIEKMRNNMIKEQKVFALVREILAYMGFMWMLLLVAYGQRDPNAYFLTQHIRQSFSKGIADTMSIQDVFNWANTTLLTNLFGEHPGFITDGNSKLVGNARLRQLRVQKNSCHVARRLQDAVHDCHALYSWESEDMGSYSPGWSSSAADNTSQIQPSPWKYQSQGKLRAYPIWGSMALYRGGGFVLDLGPDQENSSRSLQYLYENRWFDAYTQAIFVEFTVYNANVNLFCIVTLMLETTAIGAFQFRSELQNVRLYQSTGGLHIFVMASEAIYFLFILYYMFVQAKLMKQQKWAYFKSKLNLLELAIILLSWSALSVFIKRTLLGKRDMDYYQNHRDQYASFHETAKADAVLGYLIAFLVLLATVKLWHLLRLNPKLHMITATLQRAWADISGFLVVITIMFLAYSIASNLMYGWKLYSYRTLFNAAKTMVSLQLGIFNYDEILNYNPVLGAFLIGSCIVFMTFVVLNLFISVILVAFSEEQIHHKPSEEEEIVDLMMMKLCSLFGIKCKSKQEDGSLIEKTELSCASNNGISTISPGHVDKDSYVLL
ncbi:polycystic kidney disease protein 1-like 2 isoform X1 [Corythoichthys intestinalis]|uniref:polycystic kidney disease protein 1-like 2 isoform X1 n=1 Tax=Corythoichthys intestinalis TaxID=161448 RepID=UPI0025A52825|nr:polycystic kidney disease protein 1-like 2 isoform X1 [Corythoichthys intestinalis]